jgi:protein FRG1
MLCRKKFQSGPNVKVSSEKRGVLKQAKQDGKLHEALLDRREKMKADRYCK